MLEWQRRGDFSELWLVLALSQCIAVEEALVVAAQEVVVMGPRCCAGLSLGPRGYGGEWSCLWFLRHGSHDSSTPRWLTISSCGACGFGVRAP